MKFLTIKEIIKDTNEYHALTVEQLLKVIRRTGFSVCICLTTVDDVNITKVKSYYKKQEIKGTFTFGIPFYK